MCRLGDAASCHVQTVTVDYPEFIRRSEVVIRCGPITLAALGRRHLCTMRAVGGEDTTEQSQVDSRLGHQRDKTRGVVYRVTAAVFR